MKLAKLIFTYSFMCISFELFAQSITFPYKREGELSKRDRYPLEMFSDKGLKETTVGEVVDGMFIGTIRIGVDEEKIERVYDEGTPPYLLRGIGRNNDSLLIESYSKLQDTIIGGHLFSYKALDFFRSKVKIKWTTFDELRKEYFPDVQEPVVYTINKYIVSDPTFFKLDHDFIGRIERLDSRDIEALKAFPPFTFIRIFTKTRHNWYWNLNSYGLEE